MGNWINSKTFEAVPDSIRKSWMWWVQFDGKCPHDPEHPEGTCPADPGDADDE